MPFQIEIYFIERITHGQRRDGILWLWNRTLVHADQLERDLFGMYSDNLSPNNIKINVDIVTRKDHFF